MKDRPVGECKWAVCQELVRQIVEPFWDCSAYILGHLGSGSPKARDMCDK